MPVYRNYGNKWNDDRGLDDYRDNKREGVRRRGRNTPMHQENWNEGEGSHGENFGLGDTSQGSANYGHVDDGHGSRYYGTGNYGGYFGSGSDEDDNRSRHQQEYRGNERRNEYFDDKNLNRGSSYRNNEERSSNTENYERGPRYGNPNIHGRTYGSGQGYNSGQNRYGSGRNSDWNEDRDWWDKTTDEVSSWFGDEEANRRREMDQGNGPHHGKGPKGYTHSDEKIKGYVEERLYHDSFVDASDIEVSVSEGEVTLSGTVDDKQTKRRAEDCAERIAGVKDVSNHLKIKRSQSEIDQKLDQSDDLNRMSNK